MARVVIDMFKCLQCGNCEECLVVCPPKAIICNGPNMVPFIINANCTTCGACTTACPVKAISIIN